MAGLNGFFAGGFADGFQKGFSTVDNAMFNQKRLQLLQQAQQNQEQREMYTRVDKIAADGWAHIEDTVNAFKNAGHTPQEASAAVTPLLRQLIQLKTSAGMRDADAVYTAQLGMLLANPVDKQALAERNAKIAETTARAGYYQRGGLPEQSPAEAVGTYNNTNLTQRQRVGLDPLPTKVAQSAPSSTTDVGADVGEQAGEDFLGSNVPPSDRELVKSIANYDTDLTALSTRTTKGMTKSRREQMLDYALEYAKAKGENFTPRAFKVVQDFLGNGKHGDQVRSLNVITEHMGTLRQLGEALDNGDFQTFNAIAQRWAQETGKSAPTNFDNAKTIVGTELIKALGVAGAGSAEERQDLQKRLSTASSPQQISDAINEVYGPLLTGQLKGLRNQYLSAGGPRERFDKFLLPATKEYLDGGKKKAKSGSASDMSDDDLLKGLGLR